MAAPPRVAILLESSTTWGAEALEGIADYVRRHGPWRIFIEPRGWYERLTLPHGWRGEGVIARLTSAAVARRIIARGAAVVNLAFPVFTGKRVAQVTADEQAVGALAAEHLLGRGLRHLAYCGPVRYPGYHDRCGPAFAQAARSADVTCHVFSRPGRSGPRSDRQEHGRQLARWLARLPKPVGVYAWNGERAHQVADACAASGLKVPEAVAILSGEDDHVMCDLANPPLSGIDQGPRRIGFVAARTLDRMMRHPRRTGKTWLFAPLGVTARQSTEVTAVNDPALAQALRLIHERWREPIRVDHVARGAGLSRRWLEVRFRALLGRSPAEEIRRLRLDACRRLLAHTDLSIAEVSRRTGFASPEVLIRLFRRELGLTPGAFRRAER